MPSTDHTIPDSVWWGSDYASFEDFVGIGVERVEALCRFLLGRGESVYIINRLRKANGLPHGPCNTLEEPNG